MISYECLGYITGFYPTWSQLICQVCFILLAGIVLWAYLLRVKLFYMVNNYIILWYIYLYHNTEYDILVITPVWVEAEDEC